MRRAFALAALSVALTTGSRAAPRLSVPRWLLALPRPDGEVLLSWRMNPPAESVTTYAVIRDGQEIAATKLTNYVDLPPPGEHRYAVRACRRQQRGRPCRPVSVTAGAQATSLYRVIAAESTATRERPNMVPVSLGFLDRDGLVDFLHSYTPDGTTGWRRAYTHEGELLWERPGCDFCGRDRAPIIWDLDRDRVGEVICTEGLRRLVVLNGVTGEIETENVSHPVVTWEDWPASVMVADLEGRGRTWSVILKRCHVARRSQPLLDSDPDDPASGAPRPHLVAFSAKLEPLWWVALNCGAAHHAHVADVNLDGRDDIVASGLVTLDPDGAELFHVQCDDSLRVVGGEQPEALDLDQLAEAGACVVGDIAPRLPGLETVVAGAEEDAPVCLYDASGKAVWCLSRAGGPDSRLVLGDFFTAAPGLEVVCQGAADYWLSANGALLSAPRTPARLDAVEWSGVYPGMEVLASEADPDRIEIRSPSMGGAGPAAVLTYEGELSPDTVRAADVIGDYREEIVADWGGRVVIFTNTEPDPHTRPSVWEDLRIARWRYVNSCRGGVIADLRPAARAR